MPIETKVRKIGNSLGIVLPKEALLALAAGEIDADAFSAWLAQSCSPK